MYFRAILSNLSFEKFCNQQIAGDAVESIREVHEDTPDNFIIIEMFPPFFSKSYKYVLYAIVFSISW